MHTCGVSRPIPPQWSRFFRLGVWCYSALQPIRGAVTAVVGEVFARDVLAYSAGQDAETVPRRPIVFDPDSPRIVAWPRRRMARSGASGHSHKDPVHLVVPPLVSDRSLRDAHPILTVGASGRWGIGDSRGSSTASARPKHEPAWHEVPSPYLDEFSDALPCSRNRRVGAKRRRAKGLVTLVLGSVQCLLRFAGVAFLVAGCVGTTHARPCDCKDPNNAIPHAPIGSSTELPKGRCVRAPQKCYSSFEDACEAIGCPEARCVKRLWPDEVHCSDGQADPPPNVPERDDEPPM